MTVIKICGITNVEDAIACASMGAHILGFVFADSPRRADVQTVRHITRILGGDVKTVGVFTEESDEIPAIMDRCELTYAQLHGSQTDEFAAKIGADRVIRVASITDESSVAALSAFKNARYYLLDTYKKGVAGGTGETFNWELALRVVPLGKPLFLAGGLKPTNVAEAIRLVKPFAVDVSSGVEVSPGKKDHTKIKEFIENVREANHAS